mgnify:CR=1 FL=1
MIEWWYQSAEERVTAPTVYPAPPPPPAPKVKLRWLHLFIELKWQNLETKYVSWYFLLFSKVAEKGIPLPKDRRICPLCLKLRTNPALIATSGFVFCYPCIFPYISQVRKVLFTSNENKILCCFVLCVRSINLMIRHVFYILQVDLLIMWFDINFSNNNELK